LIRSAERDSDGFLKLESLYFLRDTISQRNRLEKSGAKRGGKKRQRAAMNLPQFAAMACGNLPLFAAL
jgi:hypothetical protein